MNHQQALEEHATERYLLREMTAEERHAFEEHYLECAECLEAVTFGTEFLEAGRQVAQEMAERAEVRVPSWRERLSVISSAWLRPVPAMAFALLLCLLGLNLYQLNLVHQQKNQIADLKAPKQEFRFLITEEARGSAGAERVIAVRRNTQLSVKIEFTPGQEYTPYRADFLTADKALKYSFPLSIGPNDDSVSFSIPVEALGTGAYSLMIRRQSPSGNTSDLERRFILQFTN